LLLSSDELNQSILEITGCSGNSHVHGKRHGAVLKQLFWSWKEVIIEIKFKLNFVENVQFPKMFFPNITFKCTYVCFLLLSLQFKDKLALAETGELAGSDDSTVTGSLNKQHDINTT
jgi:hypothetical protein